MHNNFKFKDSINEDIIPFNPKGECRASGIYFTETNKLILDLNNKILIKDFEGWNDINFCTITVIHKKLYLK